MDEGVSATAVATPDESATNVVPISQPIPAVRDVKRPDDSKYTDAVSKIVQKARELGAAHNHNEIGIEHFLLAMTLVPEATDVVRSRAVQVRAACLRALTEMPFVPEENGVPARPSAELAVLLAEAAELANKREPELRKLSLEDIEGVIEACPEGSRVAQLVSGQSPRPMLEQFNEALANFASGLRSIESRLRSLEQQNASLSSAASILLDRSAPKPPLIVDRGTTADGAATDRKPGLFRRLFSG